MRSISALGAMLFLSGNLIFQPVVRAESALSSFTRFLSPGKLTRPHAEEKKLRNCYTCHTLTKGIDDALCLDCHKTVKERLKSQSGYHGKLQGRCQSCHTDHKGPDKDITGLDPKAFNHRQSNYPLTGKHAEIKCDKCHTRENRDSEHESRYMDKIFGTCADCHDDPHPADFDPNCEKCHTTGGWTGRDLLFSHSRDSKYKLLGNH